MCNLESRIMWGNCKLGENLENGEMGGVKLWESEIVALVAKLGNLVLFCNNVLFETLEMLDMLDVLAMLVMLATWA